jgi:hypothetical protein
LTLISSFTFKSGKKCHGSCVVSKGFAQVGEVVDIPRAKNEAAAKLKGVQPKFVLTMACGASAITALEIVAPKYV